MKPACRRRARAALAALCAAGALALAPAPPEVKNDKIVFTSMSETTKKVGDVVVETNRVGVFIMNADGSQRTSLTKEGAIEIDPSLSPDGKRIAFVAVAKDDVKGDLWVMDVGGGDRRQLTESKAKTLVNSPSWSPDGKRIAFTRMAAQNGPPTDAEIVIVDADGKNEKSLGKGLMPAWSPDGKQVLYTTLEKGGDFEPRLTVMDADGGNAKQLFKTPSMMGAFAPDGKRIAYMGAPTTKNTTPHIYAADADGSQAAQVTSQGDTFEVGPRWSADGKRLVFSRMPNAKNGPPKTASIVVMDADGKNETELTKGDGMDLTGGAAILLMERMAAAH